MHFKEGHVIQWEVILLETKNLVKVFRIILVKYLVGDELIAEIILLFNNSLETLQNVTCLPGVHGGEQLERENGERMSGDDGLGRHGWQMEDGNS
jgi:hypothetical protein